LFKLLSQQIGYIQARIGFQQPLQVFATILAEVLTPVNAGANLHQFAGAIVQRFG
jgi:hypothetical protein